MIAYYTCTWITCKALAIVCFSHSQKNLFHDQVGEKGWVVNWEWPSQGYLSVHQHWWSQAQSIPYASLLVFSAMNGSSCIAIYIYHAKIAILIGNKIQTNLPPLSRIVKYMINSSHLNKNCSIGKTESQSDQKCLQLCTCDNPSTTEQHTEPGKGSYIALYVVNHLIGAGHETNKDWNIHDEASCYNEIVEAWTS